MTYLNINGIGLYCEVDGEGEPVLLLHGGFCSLESLRELSDALVPRYRVHAFERPGHGRSPDIAEEYGYDRGLSDTVAFLDANALESVHVIGYSDGAILALLLALEHPERVRSVVSISGNLDPTAFDRSAEHEHLSLSPGSPSSTTGAGASEERPDLERLHYDRLSPDGPEHAEVVLEKLFRLWTTEPNPHHGRRPRLHPARPQPADRRVDPRRPSLHRARGIPWPARRAASADQPGGRRLPAVGAALHDQRERRSSHTK
jgi:pimeloyl-ACP methyl ester carboxylesterase